MPTWLCSGLVLAAAALFRLPHYDVAWFGLDQIYFMADARRALAGGEAGGPLASGLDIVGPLYTYLLAGLLWIRDDPAFLALFAAICEVVATWLVFDTSRRLSGSSLAGVAAASTYATTPVLVFGTRLVWNPGLLPTLVSLGWWLTVRHRESPSTARLAALALAAGLTPPLHATGLFHGASWSVAALSTLPSLRQVAVAAAVGLIPLLPALQRLFGATSQAGALGARMTMTAEPRLVLSAIEGMTLHFPKVFGEDWTTRVSTAILHGQAAIAAIGLAGGWIAGGGWRPIWLGLGLSFALNVTSALFYSGQLSWYYFIALMPALCLCVGNVVACVGRWRPVAATAVIVLAAAQLFVLKTVDDRTLETGLIEVNPRWLTGGAGPDSAGYSLSIRELAHVGRALQTALPDGATALLAAHGVRGDLWRETGAEFMPPARAPQTQWPSDFILMGPGARPVRSDARLIGERVCVFDKPASTSWRARHGAPPSGWEQPGFADADWNALGMPVRAAGPSLAGPPTNLVIWRAPQVLLRGRVNVSSPDGKRAFAVSIHSNGASAHWIARFVVNGVELAPGKSRVMYSSLFRNEEWLFDASGRLREGENVIAIAVDGQTPGFDLDVFGNALSRRGMVPLTSSC